ncbi:hypothetical protein VUR80DRAFT_8650 [Thermomyces stellatus]
MRPLQIADCARGVESRLRCQACGNVRGSLQANQRYFSLAVGPGGTAYIWSELIRTPGFGTPQYMAWRRIILFSARRRKFPGQRVVGEAPELGSTPQPDDRDAEVRIQQEGTVRRPGQNPPKTALKKGRLDTTQAYPTRASRSR